MGFTGKCPHCGHEESHRIDAVALPGLASDRVMPVRCGNCSAQFALDLVVRTRPLADFLAPSQILEVRAQGRTVAARVRRLLKGSTRPEVQCPVCSRRFGGHAGYPATVISDGLCAVDSQVVRRRLASRRRTP